MLAPVMLDFETDMVAMANSLNALDGFARSCAGATVNQLDPPLSWIAEAQWIFDQCRIAAQTWRKARPAIIAPLVVYTTTYADLISGAAASTTAEDTAEVWIDIFSALHDATTTNSKSARDVAQQIIDQQMSFREKYTGLRRTLRDAQQGMQSVNDDIAEVGSKVQALLDRLGTYGASVDRAAMAAGQKVLQTTIQVTYQLAVAGTAAVPYFSIATTVLTIGYAITDLVVTDALVSTLLDDLSGLLGRLKSDERAVALTTSLLAQLEAMEDAYVLAAGTAPRLNSYWDAESEKLQILIGSLRGGLAPAKILDINSFTSASTIWVQLANLANMFNSSADQELLPLSVQTDTGG